MAVVKPRLPDKTRKFDQEIMIVDKRLKIKDEVGYIFNDGARKFDDKVSKRGY